MRCRSEGPVGPFSVERLVKEEELAKEYKKGLPAKREGNQARVTSQRPVRRKECKLPNFPKGLGVRNDINKSSFRGVMGREAWPKVG